MEIPGSSPLADMVILVLDLFGVFVFALSGNILAIRKGYDLTGSVLLGFLAGLGGGMVRDVLTGRVPVSLVNPIYMAVPVLAAIAVYFIGTRVAQVRRTLVTCDAIGLALFCMTGTVIALEADLPVPAALLMGVLTAAGGGILRDVVANEAPSVFNAADLYLVPALTGAGLTALAVRLDLWNIWSALVIGVFVVGFRLLSLRLRWRVPSPVRSWTLRRPRR
ncbi:trimeric intracellular cation channel family protein [Brevibacterium litoralis]|uniref:trimeric intracellular cation channel family protein n=1 Tax=Brevibacterium litoralis TaxID=3138935 RepID=UPI0032ED880F